MSSTVQAPIPGVHRRPIPWFVVAVVSALALVAAAIAVVLDGGTDTAVDRGATGQSVPNARCAPLSSSERNAYVPFKRDSPRRFAAQRPSSVR